MLVFWVERLIGLIIKTFKYVYAVDSYTLLLNDNWVNLTHKSEWNQTISGKQITSHKSLRSNFCIKSFRIERIVRHLHDNCLSSKNLKFVHEQKQKVFFEYYKLIQLKKAAMIKFFCLVVVVALWMEYHPANGKPFSFFQLQNYIRYCRRKELIWKSKLNNRILIYTNSQLVSIVWQ